MGGTVTSETKELDAPAASTRPDPARFREVLGHYPTGVVVVTGIAADGSPAGMVIGSFTSVSLEPPVVAYLPGKSSQSFARLREAETFCVNVLSADQEHLCRLFAGKSEDKFAGVRWRPASSGAPILADAVAWIECSRRDVIDVGDHYIVLGDTIALGVQKAVPPLLFFQGGYGRFSHGSLAMPGGVDFIRSVQSAELLREHLEGIARDFRAQCDVFVPDGREGVLVFSANEGPTRTVGTLVGARIPIVAPMQPLFVSEDGVSEASWTAAAALDAESRRAALEQLARVKSRGWSLVLQGRMCEADFETAVRRYSDQPRTPAGDRDFLRTVNAMAAQREPEVIDPASRYDVLYIAAPVYDACGSVALTLKLSQLPRQARGTEVLSWIAALQSAAHACSEHLSARDQLPGHLT
jgi:flavin reductase (DIM6/NTAB) family NADH-FMN oxidoreductase RutF